MMKFQPNQDLIFITIDSLRYDVAQQAFEEGLLPHLSLVLPSNGWEERYTPASFTFPAHHAFFSGFLPTKIGTEITPRLFASQFNGSKSVTENTFVFEEATIVQALQNRGYQTVCVGGVGFFNLQTQLSSVLPNLFQHKTWQEKFGVTEKKSTQYQMEYATQFTTISEPLLLFMNLSATHQPNYFYVEGATTDSVETQKQALAYIDTQLPILFNKLKKRNRKTLLIICSDHGTAYGEDEHFGHRNGHEVVMKVPYLHKFIQW